MLLRSNDVTEQKVKVAEAVSQEMTRQWFGDLVVNSDWNTLWLNEGFANYMKYFVLEKIFEGDLDGHNYQTSESFEPALIDDSRSSSHPVTLNTETPEKAQEFLDQVTAEKSGALLRMIKEVVGEEVFRKGIQLKAWDGSRLKMADFGEKWILQWRRELDV
ncbi:hypothetical protein NECAME_07999 [Necator americanus]|uniref:Peptidase M1 membrane alanine aminopeptidase domain-containing protein n=1 Tax=Necator americanus TaxID=51031 RepID=W2TL46_NECAM|nr:hypothetical protein NECAME_07999 [Necator americanus]ETN82349.1 hypothetical protein NECAME_07999 [Necator americanus]